MKTTVAALAVALLAIACAPSCGTDSVPLPVQAGSGGGADAGDVGPAPDAGLLPAPDAGAPAPDAGSPGPIACAASGAACGGAAECCSNRCPSGTCGPMCFADGQACQRATDCCSLACNGGTCGGNACAQEGRNCTANEACCSNACLGSKCVADRTGCHPAGERCVGGGFAQNVCCGTPPAACLQPGTASERCDLPIAVCRGAGVPCTLAGDCCSNGCVAGFCQ